MVDMESIGNRILERRKELRLTQTDIYNKCGIATGALSKIENGVRTPSCIIFYNLACALNCSMDWLMTGNSAQSHNIELCEKEDKLLNMFRELDHDDQEELIDIVEIKLKRKKKGSGTAARSSLYTEDGSGDMVG